MKVDVVFSSCARTDMLAGTVDTFRERFRCRDGFRTVLVEDKVDDPERARKGREWVEANAGKFDKVVFLPEKGGFYRVFQRALAQAESDYFFHMDDDGRFLVDVDVDAMVAVMDAMPDLVELILRRSPHREVNPQAVKVAGQTIVVHGFFSVSFGLFRTSASRRLMDHIGWETDTHEMRTLTPAAKRLGMRCAIFGAGTVHYQHVGGQTGFAKGAWK